MNTRKGLCNHRWMLVVFLALLIFCSSSIQVKAQSVVAEIDSIEMLIGQQVHVTLRATANEGANVVFPSFQQQELITPGIEVLARSEEHSSAKENGFVERSVVYTLTSFDDTLYYLPPFSVKIDGKAYETKSLALKVLTVEVDTLHPEQFYGPKTVQDNPFQWSEWSMAFWLSVLMIGLLFLACYLYIRLRDNKPIISSIRIVKKLLPHQKAMKEIEQIKADKMVTSEDSKEYYTKLTDTLRKYIEERYGFRAMEMTSAEIIERLDQSLKSADNAQAETMKQELRQLFSTADLVKFAKYSTLINENDANLVSAIDFINQTKLENIPTEETVKPQLTQEQLRSKKARVTLKWTIILIAIVCAALLVFVVYDIYQLIN